MLRIFKQWKNRCKASRRRRANELGWGGFWRAELEPRVLFAADLGLLDAGRHFYANQTMTGSLTSDGLTKYTFTVPDSHVDIYMSFTPLVEEPLAILGLTLEGVASTVDSPFLVGPKQLGVDLTAGTYTLDVRNPDNLDRSKTLVINIDLADAATPSGGAVNGSSVLVANVGRDLGVLSAGATTSVRDFVGGFNNDAVNDDGDMYFFDIPVTGSVSATLDQLETDVAGGTVSQRFEIYRDFDQDGAFESNELLVSRSNVTPSAGGAASTTLSAGHYGLIVRPLVGSGLLGPYGGSNYRLRLSYTPPDSGGNSLAAATNIGTVGGATVTRTDYISAADGTDVFKFTTVAGGPFNFDANVGGLLPGSDNLVQLIRDANGNNVIDRGELLASEQTFNGSGVHLSASLTAGTYLVRVSRVAGEGPYSLVMVARNTDQGGPASFPTNINFNTSALGMKEIVDTVSATDIEDVFRFDIESAATIRASFPATSAGTDANLQFIRDSNSNNVLDGGDALLRSSNTAGNAGESIATNASVGKYFLRVVRAAGTPQYDLTVNADYAGSFPSTARGMTLTGDDSSTIEYLGPGADTVDFYRFNVSGPIQLNTFMFNLGDQVTLTVGRDENRDQVIDPAETLLSKALPLGTGDRETVNLPSAGTYYVKVTFTGTVGLNYGITFASAPIDNAGNTLGDARNLGGLVSPLTFSDFVGDGTINAADDLDDFYKFTVGSEGPYVLVGQTAFVAPNSSIAMQLIHDSNNNQQIDAGEVIATTASAPGFPPPPLVLPLIDPGTYFIHILRTGGEATYTTTFSLFSTDTAGSISAAAKPLGQFGAAAGTLNSGSEFVGRIDRDDVFVVTLTNPGELSATLDAASAAAFIEIAPQPPFTGTTTPFEFDDIFAATPIEQRASTRFTQSATDAFQGLIALTAGKYLVHVHSEIDTSYSLSVSYAPESPFSAEGPTVIPFANTSSPIFQDGSSNTIVLPSTGVTIEAEDFDQGAQGVAYRDLSAGNSGGAYRATDVDIFPSSGGFVVDRADAGEFLNYSIFSQSNAQLDIDVVCGAAATGGSFHLEVDGVPVGPSQVSVPALPAGSALATVTVPNVFLAQGPHVLRLVFNTRALGQSSAGAFDSLTIRRAQTSIGTFTLTPPHATVPVGGKAPLSIGWTVPGSSWRELTTIDVRLRNEHGVVIWLRFDEANNTVALYNSHSHKFGPAKKIGSKGFLFDGFVLIDLREVSVVAAGPDSPTVTLNLSMRFLSPRGGQFHVDLAATNDKGFIGDFIEAGILDVIQRRR